MTYPPSKSLFQPVPRAGSQEANGIICPHCNGHQMSHLEICTFNQILLVQRNFLSEAFLVILGLGQCQLKSDKNFNKVVVINFEAKAGYEI